MKDFKAILGAKPEDLREIRVTNVVKQACMASRNYVESLQQEMVDLVLNLENKLDIGPTNAQDLTVVCKDFDAKTFVLEIHNDMQQLYLKKMKTDAAVKIHNSMFPDNPVDECEEIDLLDGIYPEGLLMSKSEKEA